MAEEPIENKQTKRLFIIELIMTNFNSKVVKNCIQVSMLTFCVVEPLMLFYHAQDVFNICHHVRTFHINTYISLL